MFYIVLHLRAAYWRKKWNKVTTCILPCFVRACWCKQHNRILQCDFWCTETAWCVLRTITLLDYKPNDIAFQSCNESHHSTPSSPIKDNQALTVVSSCYIDKNPSSNSCIRWRSWWNYEFYNDCDDEQGHLLDVKVLVKRRSHRTKSTMTRMNVSTKTQIIFDKSPPRAFDKMWIMFSTKQFCRKYWRTIVDKKCLSNK